MCVLWRYRLAAPLLAVLVFVVCDAQTDNEVDISKLYPRGNHWAVGHLMGKKSTDEPLDSELRDAARREEEAGTRGLLRALLSGAEHRSASRGQLTQVAKILLLALNSEDSSGS